MTDTTHRIRCANHDETTTHASVAAVAACHAGAEVGPCGWLVERIHVNYDPEGGGGEGWTVTEDCGAEAIFDARGYRCAAGHEHVTMEARNAEGWDYAEEYGEARDLAMAGVEPRTMSGHVVTGPQDFEETR